MARLSQHHQLLHPEHQADLAHDFIDWFGSGEVLETESLDERFAGRPSVQENRLSAVLCSPFGTDAPYGVVYLQKGPDAPPFTPADRELVKDTRHITARDPEHGLPANFVWGCPICMPAYEAFLTYRARPALQVTEKLVLEMEQGDLETRQPEVAAETVRLAAETGLVGCSIEDATGEKERPLYDFGHAVERVAAAAEAAKSVGFAFTLPARAENFLRGLQLVREATSFGGVHSIAERRARWGGDQVAEGFIRFSVGCEAADDLVADVEEALGRAAGV